MYETMEIRKSMCIWKIQAQTWCVHARTFVCVCVSVLGVGGWREVSGLKGEKVEETKL